MAPPLDIPDLLEELADTPEVKTLRARGVDIHAPAFESAEGRLSSVDGDGASRERVDQIVRQSFAAG